MANIHAQIVRCIRRGNVKNFEKIVRMHPDLINERTILLHADRCYQAVFLSMIPHNVYVWHQMWRTTRSTSDIIRQMLFEDHYIDIQIVKYEVLGNQLDNVIVLLQYGMPAEIGALCWLNFISDESAVSFVCEKFECNVEDIGFKLYGHRSSNTLVDYKLT